MELQGGLVGWHVKKLTQMLAGGHSISMHMGAFFRLRLDITAGGLVSGTMEMTEPGESATESSCTSSFWPGPGMCESRC
jgi:hypothetical protein